jgi:hypothetical protein
MNEWNPDDPDASSVHYDLSSWNFDQQAELAAAMAEAEIPHGWVGTELVVPDEYEQQADALIADVEAQLGVVYVDTDEAPVPPLCDDEPTTEYDLDEWPEADRATASRVLTEARIGHRWEGTVLLVPTAEESVVESLLDDVERGEFVDMSATGDSIEPDLDAEILTTFFLAGERLRRDPLDPDGLEQLVEATAVADPERPPFGVQLPLWQQSCALADRVADAIAGDDAPDYELAAEAAGELHDLLRPYI